MENLAPSLQFALQFRYLLEKGDSVSVAINQILSEMPQSSFRVEVEELILSIRSGKGAIRSDLRHPHRQLLFNLIEKGWRGEPIVPQLAEWEDEAFTFSEEDIDLFASRLPLFCLFPLLLLQFPALVLLFIGPFLSRLLN